MFFQNRMEAGKKLAQKLISYKNFPNGIIIALPRGGVPVAYQVAEALNLPLDIISPRKIGAPFNPEYAIGAITETGEGIFNEAAITRLNISENYLSNEIKKEQTKAQERLSRYRVGMPPRQLEGKTIFLIDDGLATGLTMKAAIQSLQETGVDKIIVAVPVAPPDTIQEISSKVDALFCLETPPYFEAVGQFYYDFSQTTDEEVIELLSKSWEFDKKGP